MAANEVVIHQRADPCVGVNERSQHLSRVVKIERLRRKEFCVGQIRMIIKDIEVRLWVFREKTRKPQKIHSSRSGRVIARKKKRLAILGSYQINIFVVSPPRYFRN